MNEQVGLVLRSTFDKPHIEAASLPERPVKDFAYLVDTERMDDEQFLNAAQEVM